mgnify:FL=1
MRAASDLHLAPHTAQWVFEALADLRADAQTFGGPTILTGDIFDQSKVVDMPLYNRLRDELRAFPTEVIILPGNHDQYDGWRNVCEALESDNSVTVVSEPDAVPRVGIFVPHTDPAQWAREVDHLRKGFVGPPLVFAHQGFKGSYLNNMTRDRTGLRVSGLDGLVVVTGHYHMPQNVAQVIYCGSPYQTSHAETGQEKGFLVWRDRPRTTWADWVPERIAYTSVTAPRYWTVQWDGTGDPQLPAGHREGDIVRIVTTRAREDLDGKALKRVGLQGAAIVSRPASTPRVDLRATRPSEAVSEYLIAARRDNIDPTDLRDFMEEQQLWPGA